MKAVSKLITPSRSSILCVLIALQVIGVVIGKLNFLGHLGVGEAASPGRHLLSGNPWTSPGPDRVCWPSYQGRCEAGDFALLSMDAPVPVTLGGKLLAKTLAQGYQCWQHQTITSCQSDGEGRCSWLSDSSVCHPNSTSQLQTVREALLCPDSPAEQLFICSSKFKSKDCTSAGGCSWSNDSSVCVPAAIAAMAADEITSLLPSVSKLDASVWGCCEGHRILRFMLNCSASPAAACVGDCEWDVSTGSCGMSQQGLMDQVLGRVDQRLVDYLVQGDSVCSSFPGNIAACGSNDMINVDPIKVEAYASWVPTKEERGSCSSDLAHGEGLLPGAARNTTTRPIIVPVPGGIASDGVPVQVDSGNMTRLANAARGRVGVWVGRLAMVAANVAVWL